jgi:hypothetical protein
MDRLASIRAFVTIAKTGSFTNAADVLGVSRGYLSRAISDLEAHTRTRLLNRTTRRVTLAEGAREYFETCSKLVRKQPLPIDCYRGERDGFDGRRHSGLAGNRGTDGTAESCFEASHAPACCLGRGGGPWRAIHAYHAYPRAALALSSKAA